MPKCKPSQRRHPEKTPRQPRDRLAEIRAEIQDVQQQIETKRRDGHVIRTAEDFESLKRAIAALTNRLSALLMAEATQVALDDPENRPRPAPGMVQKRPFSGNTRALSADPDRSRVGAGLRESLVAVLGLQVRENRVYPRSSSQ